VRQIPRGGVIVIAATVTTLGLYLTTFRSLRLPDVLSAWVWILIPLSLAQLWVGSQWPRWVIAAFLLLFGVTWSVHLTTGCVSEHPNAATAEHLKTGHFE